MTREVVTEDPAGGVEEHPCTNHPGTLTVVACGKCGRYICPRCMIFTPVGVRCRDCAQLRRPTQFDVEFSRLAVGALAGLVVASIGWLIAAQIVFFTWILAIFVGLAVGEAVSRIARRRVNRWLEIAVGVDIVAGYAVGQALHWAAAGLTLATVHAALLADFNDPFEVLFLLLAVLAGVTRLRR